MRRRTTDFGTVILHAALVVAFLVLLATGLRISTDDPDRHWVRLLDPLLPNENLWFRHLVAGLAMAAVIAAYAIYLQRARLGSRLRLDLVRLLAIVRPGPQRWAALNVVVNWVLIAGLITEVVTGLLLFIGTWQVILWVHRDATFVCLAALVAHVALHAASGGRMQLLRILRPAPLTIGPPPLDLAELLAEQLSRQAGAADASPAVANDETSASPRRRPLLAAAAMLTALAVAALATERVTRPVLRIAKIAAAEAPPVLDGDLSDPAWMQAQPAKVLTTQGGDFGGTYQSTVEVRAVHDGTFVYFAFTWEDPTRSLKHLPLVKTGGRWRIAASNDDFHDEETFHEDKLAVLLAPPGLPLIGAAIHLARRPLSGRPQARSGRGLHYTDGVVVDVWQWRASHNYAGHVDNCHIGGPADAVIDEEDTLRPYSGGFRIDPGGVPYSSNIADTHADGIRPRRLPRDPAAMAQALGRISNGRLASEGDAARWFVTEAESVPYSAEIDAGLPDWTVVPSVVFADQPAVRTDSVRGVARWAAGRWTLEVARRLDTGSPHDIAIAPGILLWVAAFDHAEKRHTRHLRPLTLEID